MPQDALFRLAAKSHADHADGAAILNASK